MILLLTVLTFELICIPQPLRIIGTSEQSYDNIRRVQNDVGHASVEGQKDYWDDHEWSRADAQAVADFESANRYVAHYM